MTQDEFFITYDKLIRGLIYKYCNHKDMCDDVYSEVVMSLLNAGTVFDLPKPVQVAYITKAVKITSMCKSKKLRKSKTYGDLQSEDNDTDPEEYAIPDDTYSPETEHQDSDLRATAIEIAESFKKTKKLLAKLKQTAGGLRVCNHMIYGIGLIDNAREQLHRYKLACLFNTKNRIWYLKNYNKTKEQNHEQ